RDLADAARKVAEKISHILAALQSGSRGTQACINAETTIMGLVSDLDTTVMFATAGTLNPEVDGEKFTDHREDILRNAKMLVEATKALVPAAQA
ncbi:hypothetical protein, partial [Salmonella sp. s54925]|uniref:hypothetical protein n=1 Tax=Salmonella sp. s54925 TaxID=3159674 RepID=UPI00397EE130